jgi:hypothetical protein
MPHRRTAKKGSFGGHFDDLVKHFPHERAKSDDSGEGDRREEETPTVHDNLFERAWREARDETPRVPR